jgi:diacylglycerol kinase family enzyme
MNAGLLFFNPSSGVKLPPAELTALETAATEAGLELYRVTSELDIPAIIRERLRLGRTLVVAAGGDGTIHHVVQPLINNPEATLAVIPVGTYNHFAKDLGIPLDWRAALEVALKGTTEVIDAARVNDRYFVNNVSLGLYPELVARREERGRDYPRWKARLWAFYATLSKYPHVTFTVESEHHQEVIRSQVFMVSNNSYDLCRMGIEAPRTTLTEGRLTVYWLNHISRLAMARFVAHYLAGRVTTTPGFRSFRTSRLKVQSRHRHLQVGVDGEVFTFDTPLVITTVPQSLQVRTAGLRPAVPAA